jgi:beta-glucosidase
MTTGTPGEPSASPRRSGTGPPDGLSLVEKAALTTGASYWFTQSAPAIDLPAIRLSDGPHGLRVQDDDNPDHLGLGRSLPATCFPPAVTLASSWDVHLIEDVGAALGREARGVGVDVVLGPGLNIKRTPLCGRNFEYFSEDPLLSGLLAAAFVQGLQSQGVGACVKHFAANNQEVDRYRISADIDERPLREIYLRGFQIVVTQARPWMLMTSYNRINGAYADESQWLVTGVLREEWGYDGVVVSDWGAVYDPVAAVRAGVDLRMPGRPDDPHVRDAAQAGTVTEGTLDGVVERLLRLRDRIRGSAPVQPVDPAVHHDLTRRAAAESAVLLTNDNYMLPIDPSGFRRIAVIGELARTPRYQGAGSSAVYPTRLVTALDAFTARLSGSADVQFAAGYALDSGTPSTGLLEEAVRAADEADVTVLFVGLPPSAEAEGSDRTHIDLPPDQIRLVTEVGRVSSRVVVALSNGAAVTTAPWRHHVSAIVEFWLTGQAYGETVVDVLLGEVNPSGKLAETVPRRLRDTPAFLDYPGEHGHVRYGEGIYVGYRYYDARQLDVDFPFGHGLSYTDFEYRDLAVTCHPAGEPVAVTVELSLTNIGARAGAEVVQVYVHDQAGLVATPPQELCAFAKVRLDAGQQARLSIAVPRDRLQHYHPGVGWAYTGGPAEVRIGSSSRDIRLRARVDLPPLPLDTKLTMWSTLDEWNQHPELGPRLAELIDRHGGIRGRAGDLLSDPVGRSAILSVPLKGLMQFPGFPVGEEDVKGLLAQ